MNGNEIYDAPRVLNLWVDLNDTLTVAKVKERVRDLSQKLVDHIDDSEFDDKEILDELYLLVIVLRVGEYSSDKDELELRND